MKILIISSPRTGGNVFSKWLSVELNYKWIHEPFHNHFNEFNDIEKVLNEDNIVVKVQINDWSKKYTDTKFYNFFDKIIGLTRNNLKETSISLLKAFETKNFTKNYKIDDEWITENENKQSDKNRFILLNRFAFNTWCFPNLCFCSNANWSAD